MFTQAQKAAMAKYNQDGIIGVVKKATQLNENVFNLEIDDKHFSIRAHRWVVSQYVGKKIRAVYGKKNLEIVGITMLDPDNISDEPIVIE